MKNFIILSYMFFGVTAFAQAPTDLPQVVPPSPTVANLMSFEEVPVDYYTGQPDIGIPLFSKSVGNGLAMNIVLKYHTAGVKIDSKSSWVGTGWSLLAGGSISRTVRGAPDEFQKGPDSPTKTGVMHNPDFWNYDNLSSYDKADFNWNANGTSADQFDSQLDLYQFNFLGVSGRFVIVKVGSVLKPVLLTKNQNVKISLTYDALTYKISAFTLTDTGGNKYIFDVIEETESQPVTGSIAQGNNSLGTIPVSGAGGVYTNRSAWHLSAVKTSNNIILASLNYLEHLESYTASVTRTENRITSVAGNINDMVNNAYNIGIMKPRLSVSYLTTTSRTKKLANISFKDSTSVEFSTAIGHPETTGVILKEVIIKNSLGIEDKRFSLTHENTDRLWLTKVTEKAGAINLDHTLAYFNKNELPAFDSGADGWGYNDGRGDYTTTCSQQINFDLDAIKKGLLTSITYPTGGKKAFSFEHNTFSYEGSSVLATADFFTYNPTNIESSSLVSNYNLSNANNTSLLQPFTVSFKQDVFINNNLTAYNQEGLNRTRIVVTDNNGFLYYLELDQANCTRLSLEPGSYSFGVQVIDPLTLDPYNVSGTATLLYQTQKASYTQEALGGGVRIKEITFTDLADPFIPKKKITYSYTDALNTSRSSGSADAKVGSLLQKYPITTFKYLFGGSENASEALSSRQVIYEVTSNGNTAQLTKGGYIGYKTVTVSETSNGKTVFNYTSPQDFPSPPGTFDYPFPPAPNLDYKRGLPLNQTVYDQSGKILSETSNTLYNYIETVEAPSFRVYDPESCGWKQFYDRYVDNINSSNQINVPICGQFPCLTSFGNCGLLPIYAIKDNMTSGWAQLTASTTKEYFYDSANNQTVTEKRQEFDYNPDNFQQSEVRSYHKENGVEVLNKTQLFYAVGGYPSTEYTAAEQTAITNMQLLNMINEPVYTRNYRGTELLGSVQKTYYQPILNMVKLQKVKTKKSADTTEERLTFHSHDSHGNPLEVSKTDGSRISYIWGHNKTLPIAKIENATYAQIASALGITVSVLDTYNESNMVAIDGLRNNTAMSNAMISTYTYTPLIGVTSMTDPRGYTINYLYDNFNRLKEIRDADNNLISENEYHYKGQ